MNPDICKKCKNNLKINLLTSYFVPNITEYQMKLRSEFKISCYINNNINSEFYPCEQFYLDEERNFIDKDVRELQMIIKNINDNKFIFKEQLKNKNDALSFLKYQGCNGIKINHNCPYYMEHELSDYNQK